MESSGRFQPPPLLTPSSRAKQNSSTRTKPFSSPSFFFLQGWGLEFLPRRPHKATPPRSAFPPTEAVGKVSAIALGKGWGQELRRTLASERQWEGDQTVPLGSQTKCSFPKLWSGGLYLQRGLAGGVPDGKNGLLNHHHTPGRQLRLERLGDQAMMKDVFLPDTFQEQHSWLLLALCHLRGK